MKFFHLNIIWDFWHELQTSCNLYHENQLTMKKCLILSLLLLLSCTLFAQYKQNVRGEIIDTESKISLPGANVALLSDKKSLGTISNENGEFELFNVPIGRYNLSVSYMGYEPIMLRNIEVTSGKEKVVTIELSEKVIAVDEVMVTARKNGELRNQMATLSSRSFSVKETEHYAGSWGDPSRMAANFAGVITANDSRNDIIIRGNSPQGLLWKLEGISIPNPNHFGALGSTGGPVSILNNNILTNSDFFTGAFPADYGNALSGVFDLRMRNGNNQKHEFVGQAGFNGFELGAEGPISKKAGSSYMVNYRYSVLEVMDKLGFDVADGAVPEYQDLTLKLNLPTKNYGTFSLFALGGNSHIKFKDDESEGGSVYDIMGGVLTENGSSLGVLGLTHRLFPDKQSNLYSTISVSYQGVTTQIDSTFDDRDNKRYYAERNGETRFSASSKYTRKLNARNTITTGADWQRFAINYIDSVTGMAYEPQLDGYIKQLDTHENNLNLLQAFGEWQHRLDDHLTLYGGLHYQQFFFNNTFSIDPRLSVSYKFDNSAKISVAYGKHAQLQPMYVYFTESYNSANNTYLQTNTKLGFSKAHHFVAGYDQLLTKNLQFKIETYYQNVYNIPVTKQPSYFSLVNAGSSFHQDREDYLVNNGLARNYGTEITIERFLDNHYYFLLTTSLFDSKYKASDGLWRNTEFNTNYVVNALGGYEILINEKMAIDFNIRVVSSGGKRNRYINLEQSKLAGETVYDDSKAYSEKGAPYFRLDGRISFKMNGKKATQEWALDMTNITDHNNVFSSYYSNKTHTIAYVYQQAFFPMFLYRINF